MFELMKRPRGFSIPALIIVLSAAGFYFFNGSSDQLAAENKICSGTLEGKTIVLLGDSLAVGLSDPLRNLTESKKGDFFPDAVGGTTVDYWLGERIDDVLARAEKDKNRYPSVVFISLGTNDSNQNIAGEPAAFKRKIGELLSEIKSDVLVIWIGPPRWPPSDGKPLDTLPAKKIILKNLDERTKYFDSRILDLNNTNRNDGDRHPSPAGYRLWAEEIWRWCGGLN